MKAFAAARDLCQKRALSTCKNVLGCPLCFRLFVSGGCTGSKTASTTASVEMLDLNATSEWKESAPMNEKRFAHAMLAFNTELFVFGGYDGKDRLKSCEK